MISEWPFSERYSLEFGKEEDSRDVDIIFALEYFDKIIGLSLPAYEEQADPAGLQREFRILDGAN
jgi:hypothetical protein